MALAIEPRTDVVERARWAAARIAKRASVADKERVLAPETVRDLHEAGLLTLVIPREQGGTEADLVTQLAVYEVIGGACASTAWVLGNHSTLCTRAMGMMGAWSRHLIQTVVEDGAVISHGAIPAGTTHATSGGFITSGRWPFVSGSNIATWIFLSTMVPGPNPDWVSTAANPNPPGVHNRWLLVPADEPNMRIEPTWMAMAVLASMSHDVVAEKLFVAEAQSPVDNRPAPHLPWLPDGPKALRVPSRARVWMAAMMLGIARVALEETIEFAKSRSMSLGGGGRTAMPGNQFAVADAAMALESARAFLFQEAGAITAKADSGEAFLPADSSRMDMAGLVARENAQKAVDRLFAIRGAHGLFETDAFERYYRDVRIGTLHAVSTPDLVREQVGKYLFGIPGDVSPRWG